MEVRKGEAFNGESYSELVKEWTDTGVAPRGEEYGGLPKQWIEGERTQSRHES